MLHPNEKMHTRQDGNHPIHRHHLPACGPAERAGAWHAHLQASEAAIGPGSIPLLKGAIAQLSEEEMKSQLLFIAALASAALAAPLLDNAPAFNQAVIDEVNAANTTWTAGFNGRFFGVKMSAVRSWLGVLPDSKLPEVIRTAKADAIPDTFDSRTAWPNCASISTIRDQANCGSCWAFGAVEAMSDRICIASGQTNQVQLSAQHLVSCTSPITGQGSPPPHEFAF